MVHIRIKELREAKGLFQRELAATIGVCQPAVARWETGGKLPTADKLPLLAAALGCSIDELFGVPPAKPTCAS